jgi:hypothetical protein
MASSYTKSDLRRMIEQGSTPKVVDLKVVS